MPEPTRETSTADLVARLSDALGFYEGAEGSHADVNFSFVESVRYDLPRLLTRVAELEAALDESRGDAGRAHGQAGALLARVVELRAQVAARDARVAELEAQRDRVTDLFEAWAAEENEHRIAGEHGLAEGLHVAIEMLRLAVHGSTEPAATPSARGLAAMERAEREDGR